MSRLVSCSGWSALVAAAVIGVRLLWVLTTPFAIRALDRRESQRARRSRWQERMVTGWAGMRGSVSLAAALAIPFSTDSGAAFPDRELIIFIAFAVLVVTLVGQGLTLGPLINRLGIDDDGTDEREEMAARTRLAEAALQRLEEVSGEDWVREDTVERVQGMYTYRQRRFSAQQDGDESEYEERTSAYTRLMFELLDAQREALIGMRNSSDISDEIRRRVERDLDLEESRLQD